MTLFPKSCARGALLNVYNYLVVFSRHSLVEVMAINYFCRTKDADKNDVYDIGVILLEIILGRPIMFHNEVGTLKDLVSITFKFQLSSSNLFSLPCE